MIHYDYAEKKKKQENIIRHKRVNKRDRFGFACPKVFYTAYYTDNLWVWCTVTQKQQHCVILYTCLS